MQRNNFIMSLLFISISAMMEISTRNSNFLGNAIFSSNLVSILHMFTDFSVSLFWNFHRWRGVQPWWNCRAGCSII